MALLLEDRRLIFVGGKGGVGKTTIAAAVALHLSDTRRRCLVVSTDPAHSLGDVFGVEIGNRPRDLAPGLQGLEIDPNAQADEYLAGVKRNMREFVHPRMYHEIDRQMDLARASPGAVEAAMLERVAELMASAADEHDVIVFDTAPTGQTLRLLSLPEIMAAWTDGLFRHRERSEALSRALTRMRVGSSGSGGDELSLIDDARPDDDSDPRFRRIRETLLARRRTFQRARRLLSDEEVTAFFLVLVPERLPILETRTALDSLRRFRVPVAGLVVNRMLPEGPLGDFLEARRSQERRYMEQIDRELGGIPQERVPLFPNDVSGLDGLREVSRHLFSGA